MSARFEVVHTDAGWHLRLLASNGLKVLTSEVYTRKRAAYRAIDITREAFWVSGTISSTEVREVDERESPR